MLLCAKLWSHEFESEIDREGCIEPDNDEPQMMGNSSVEVSSSFFFFFSFCEQVLCILVCKIIVMVILCPYC